MFVTWANLTLFQNVYGLKPAQVDKYLGQVLGQQFADLQCERPGGLPGAGPAGRKYPTTGADRRLAASRTDAPNLYKRWMICNASVSIYTFEAGVKNISFEAVAFYQTRHLNVTLNGKPVTTLTVEPSGMMQVQSAELEPEGG